MTVRKDFITMDDRLWSPEEWAVWLRYLDKIGHKTGHETGHNLTNSPENKAQTSFSDRP